MLIFHGTLAFVTLALVSPLPLLKSYLFWMLISIFHSMFIFVLFAVKNDCVFGDDLDIDEISFVSEVPKLPGKINFANFIG